MYQQAPLSEQDRTLVRHTRPHIVCCGTERTNEEWDELWAHRWCILFILFNQSLNAMTTILVGWIYHVNTTCPCRAPGFQPRVHLEVSMTIVSIDSRLTNPFPACRRFSSFWCFIFVSHQEDRSDAAAWSYMCILLRYYLVN